MVHRLAERGLTAEYEIAYQIGAGRIAHSYMVQVNGYLFESPATWFRAYGWDVSPGYAAAPVVDFDRPITETCLFCHASAAKFSGTDGRRVDSNTVTAITCERCHGTSEAHVRRPSAANIVNPARLPNRARDSICEQCHLEGEARILNPGKNWRDFHPGDNLESVAAVYVVNQDGHDVKAVSQIEQLAHSRCAAASAGKLWCGTCHNPHGQTTDRKREIRDICSSCHARLSTASHSNIRRECVDCHMPRVPTEYAHVAVTDHRIVRRPAVAAKAGETGPKALVAWVEPPIELRKRDLVLAGLAAGSKRRARASGLASLDLAGALPKSINWDDAAALAVMCESMLEKGDTREGVSLCRRAAENQPESADRAMALGVALARSGDLTEAERQLRRAIHLDPSLKHAYVELWTLYDRQKRLMEMDDTLERYLRWNPRNVMFRILKAAVEMESVLADLPMFLLHP